ncbi:putative Integral membrane bound transporter domain-containing protein [Pararobbsia alpina]
MFAARAVDSLMRIRVAIGAAIAALDRAQFAHTFWMAAGIACSVWIADLSGLDGPYWAGITAMVVALPDRRSMLLKCGHRLAGTYVGAAIGLALVKLVGGSLVLFCAATFVVVFVGLWMTQVASWPYAWRIGSITSAMVLTGGAVAPEHAHVIAVFRPAEVTIGVVTMALFQLAAVSVLGAPTVAAAAAPAASAGSAASGSPATITNIERFRNACSPAFAACVTFLLCRVFELPGGAQSVISVCALALTGPLEKVERKAAQRLLGAALGAVAGLAVALGLGFEHAGVAATVTYWAVMVAVAWCLSVLNRGPADCAYLGLQAEITFLVVCAQTSKPSASFESGFTRLEGVLIGVAVFYAIEALLNIIVARLHKSPTAGGRV